MKDFLGDDAFDVSQHEIAFLCPITYCPETANVIDVYDMARTDGVVVKCGMAFINKVTVVETFMYDSKTQEKKFGLFVGMHVGIVKSDMTHMQLLLPLCSSFDADSCLEKMKRYIINVNGDMTAVLDELRQVTEALAETLPNVYTVIQ